MSSRRSNCEPCAAGYATHAPIPIPILTPRHLRDRYRIHAFGTRVAPLSPYRVTDFIDHNDISRLPPARNVTPAPRVDFDEKTKKMEKKWIGVAMEAKKIFDETREEIVPQGYGNAIRLILGMLVVIWIFLKRGVWEGRGQNGRMILLCPPFLAMMWCAPIGTAILSLLVVVRRWNWYERKLWWRLWWSTVTMVLRTWGCWVYFGWPVATFSLLMLEKYWASWGMRPIYWKHIWMLLAVLNVVCLVDPIHRWVATFAVIVFVRYCDWDSRPEWFRDHWVKLVVPFTILWFVFYYECWILWTLV